MKKRCSLEKANWSNTREEQYRKDCEEILFKNGDEMLVIGNEVYLESGEEKTLLLQVDKPKAMWYETWLKLRNS